MRPFKNVQPGAFRKVPIRVSHWHLACFPFPTEMRGLMPQFFDWLRSPPEGPGVDPFLRACDVFLVTAHLHPFMDGNGRMARMLASLAMAHGGCRPAVLETVCRSEYAHTVYAAQHEGRVADFYRFCLRHAVRERPAAGQQPRQME